MIEHIQINGLPELQTLQGVAIDSEDLGIFTGSTISDNSTIKVALQELETEAEQPFNQSADDLSDVTYSGAPAVGEMLTWEAVNGWVNKQALSVNIGVDTTNFNNNLSVADDTVQKALETLDDIAAGSTAAGVSTNTTSFNGILSAADTNVQLALDTIDDIDYANGTAYSNHVADGTIHYTQASISIPASQISDFDTEVSNNTSVTANTAHATADGKSHSDVVLNNTHRTSDGKNHSDVVLNSAHRSSDGKNHSDVVLNNTHRGSTGTDHSYINQSVTTAVTPSFTGLDLPAASTETRILTIGGGRADNGYSIIDFIGDATYSGYGLRIIRRNVGANSDSSFAHRGTGKLIFECFDAGAITFETNNIERLRVAPDGNVGIGTTSPLSLQHIHGTIPAIRLTSPTTGATSADGFQFGVSSSDQSAYLLNRENTDLWFSTNGTEKARIKAGGNVLINTTTDAGYKLDVNGTFRAVGAGIFDSTLVVGDHGTGTTDQVVNVCYGTGATPPTASTTTEGSIYIQYTA